MAWNVPPDGSPDGATQYVPSARPVIEHEPAASVVHPPTDVVNAASEYAVNGAPARGTGSPVTGSRSPTAWTAIEPAAGVGVSAAPARGGAGRQRTMRVAAASAARDHCDSIKGS